MTYLHKFSFIAPLVFLALLLVPAIAFGQEGLVPCGNEGQRECGFDDFLVLIQSVINFLMFSVAAPLATVSFAWAGFKLMTAGGNQSAMEDAKKIFTAVLFGLGLALSAWLIVKLIVGTLLDPDYILLTLRITGVV